MSAPGRAIAVARPGTATWLVVALLAFACEREEPRAPPAPATGVTVIGTAGVVTRAGDGQAVSPAVVGALAVGDRIATAGDGTAQLRLADGREVELHPGTQLRVEAGAPGEIVLRLE